MQNIKINTEYIKLGQLLKLAAVTSQGSDAKILINSGAVKVNGEECRQRGRKLRNGDTVDIEGEGSFKVCI